MLPVLVLAQGRSGGTWFADEVAKLVPESRLYLEPLNTHYNLRRCTTLHVPDPGLRHRIRPDPYDAFRHIDLEHMLRLGAEDRLRYLVDATDGVPVVKVCRFAGRARRLVAAMAPCTVLHLWRDERAQTVSRQRTTLTTHVWGEEAVYGVTGEAAVHQESYREGVSVADLSLKYESLRDNTEDIMELVGGFLRVE